MQNVATFGLSGALRYSAERRASLHLKRLKAMGCGDLVNDKAFVASIVDMECKDPRMLRGQVTQYLSSKHRMAIDVANGGSREAQDDLRNYRFEPLISNAETVLASTGALADILTLFKSNPVSTQDADLFFTQRDAVSPPQPTTDGTHTCLTARLNFTNTPARIPAHSA